MKRMLFVDRLDQFEREVGKDACWLWPGGVGKNGYPTVGHWAITGKDTTGHRRAYETLIGPVPVGVTLDHLCNTRRCINPWHLQFTTRGANVLRGDGPSARAARQTHCPFGHPYSGDNLLISRYRRNGGWQVGRRCRICRDWWNHRNYAVRVGKPIPPRP